ncbi:hypothetical protein BC834DRAFT_973476 [Gloeopeniophorella convolvens]|nr:hypothetical protein BC834DRAFT_973476 [Gloeopeniophorella convolvens]
MSSHRPASIFLDLEAQVDDRESEDEVDEDDLNDFFADDSVEEDDDAGRVLDSDNENEALSREAENLDSRVRELVGRYMRRDGYGDQVPQHLLHPTSADHELYMVKVKLGLEETLVSRIASRCLSPTESRPPLAAAVFARRGIPGHLFIEGPLPEVERARRGLVGFMLGKPTLVPPHERAALLATRSPVGTLVKEGRWVQCLEGLYRGDTGYVCEYDPSSDIDSVVTLVPRVPDSAISRSDSGTRGRLARPEPKVRTGPELITLLGPRRVKEVDPGRYKLRSDIYQDGLVLKSFPSQSLRILEVVPADIGPFILAPCIRERFDFSGVLLRHVQDSLGTGDRVMVERGSLQGVTGRITTRSGSEATVKAEEPALMKDRVFQSPLWDLRPLYCAGDFVRGRWTPAYGIIALISEEDGGTLTFIEPRSALITTLPQHFVRFHDPTNQYLRIMEGTWVNYVNPRDVQKCSRRAKVVWELDGRARVWDEDRCEMLEFHVKELSFAQMQDERAQTLPQLQGYVGHRILVTVGNWKGYEGVIKDVDQCGLIVEFQSRLYQYGTRPERVSWGTFKFLIGSNLYKEAPLASSSLRAATPPPDPELIPERESTPIEEGEGAKWLLDLEMALVLRDYIIPLDFKGVPESSSAWTYRDLGARTVRGTPTVELGEGEVVVSVVHRKRRREIAIDPRHLTPWKPAPGNKAAIVTRPYTGMTGRVVSYDGDTCVMKMGEGTSHEWPITVQAKDVVTILEY